MKAGKAYEELVAIAISAFDPGAKVSQGKWVEGPDGQRDMDVLVEGAIFNQGSTRLLIECKDYSPKATGPVGISYFDALDSKRRDLGIPYALICSNSGFTDPALRKAKRLGLGAVSVVQKNNEIIKIAITEKNYYQVCKILDLNISYQLYKPRADAVSYFDAGNVLYHRKPIS